jgi:hypothetical protein
MSQPDAFGVGEFENIAEVLGSSPLALVSAVDASGLPVGNDVMDGNHRKVLGLAAEEIGFKVGFPLNPFLADDVPMHVIGNAVSPLVLPAFRFITAQIECPSYVLCTYAITISRVVN